MASLVKVGRLVARPLLAKRAVLVPACTRSYAYWNKDWKPGPFPTTPEERAAAAKKYGLRPEDYQPYPDDGMGYGDYPMLERNPVEARDAYENWDIPELKKNYGEPLHVDIDAMREDAWNPKAVYKNSFSYMYGWFFAVVGTITLCYILMLPYPHHHKVMPKQYAQEGKTHYTFEPVE